MTIGTQGSDTKMAVKEQNRWLTPEELERDYGITQSTQGKYRMAKNKQNIPFTKIGSKFIRYDRLLIDKWLEENAINL